MAKVGRKRLFSDHAMSANERMRRMNDRECSIDAQLEEAYKNIDWSRRKFAE